MTRKKTTKPIETISGKQLEELFDIPQQYRSRYDKQFQNFISPPASSPREYTEFDVLAYQMICQMKGQSRIIIAKKLAEMAKNDIIKFYPTPAAKTVDSILEYSPLDALEKKNGTEPKQIKRSNRHTDAPKSGYQLAEEIGMLKEKIRFLEEQLEDANLFIDELADTVARMSQDYKATPQLIDNVLMRLSKLEKIT